MASFAALFLISCLSFCIGGSDLALSSVACLLGALVPFLHLIDGFALFSGAILAFRGYIW